MPPWRSQVSKPYLVVKAGTTLLMVGMLVSAWSGPAEPEPVPTSTGYHSTCVVLSPYTASMCGGPGGKR